MGVETFGMRLFEAGWGRSLGLCLGIGVALVGMPGQAQITPDGSLGSQVNGSELVGCDGTGICEITGGTPAGGNLFHSFRNFSLSGGEAQFLVNPAVESVFTRVTGGQSSNIDGLLSMPGSGADLFLMNPAGITFGPNARLNLSGSFAATTATGIGFEDGSAFDLATSPAEAGLLTVEPSAFLYSQIPQPVRLEARATLEITPSLPDSDEPKQLILAGGDVEIGEGGILRSPGGIIFLVGLSTPGRIDVTPGGDILFSDGAERAGINISPSSTVDVVAGDAGSILFYAQDINILGTDDPATNTYVCAGIGPGSLCSSGVDNQDPSSIAGNILFDATGAVSIQKARIENNLNPGALGNGGNILEIVANNDLENFFGSIVISAESFSLEDGAELSVSTFGTGSAGAVFIGANNLIRISNGGIFSSVTSNAIGDTGGVILQAPRIAIDQASVISSDIDGQTRTPQLGRVRLRGETIDAADSRISTEVNGQQGDAGIIEVQADERIRVSNTDVFSSVRAGATGDAGGVLLQAPSVLIERGSQVSSDMAGTARTLSPGAVLLEGTTINVIDSQLSAESLGRGDAGIVGIQATEKIQISNGQVFSNVRAGATGNAGGVLLQAPDIFIERGSLVSSDILGTARTPETGAVLLDGDSILIDNSAVSTEVLRVGNAGLIFLAATDSAIIQNEGKVTSSLGFSNNINSPISVVGDAGDIRIVAGRLIKIDQGSAVVSDINSGALGVNIDSQTQDVEVGGAGSILLDAPEVQIINNSEASTTAFGRGAAGSVSILAEGDVLLENQGKIFANAQDQATSGGAILVVADRLISRDRSGLTSSNFTSNNAQALNTSNIPGGTPTGEGGATLVFARRIVLDDNSFIGAVSTSGNGGGILLFTEEYTALNDDSFITTSSFETDDGRFINDSGELVGSGGNIFSFTQFLSSTPMRDSDLFATAIDGKGGFIFVDALTLFDIAERPLNISSNDISAESGSGVNGTVSVNALDIDPSRSLDDLPADRLPELLAEGCRPTGRPVPKDKFYSSGSGGLPPNPGDPLRSGITLTNFDSDPSGNVAVLEAEEDANTADAKSTELESSETAIASPTNPKSQPIIAARGWLRDENGDVYFSAKAPNLTAQTGPKPYSSCSAAS